MLYPFPISNFHFPISTSTLAPALFALPRRSWGGSRECGGISLFPRRGGVAPPAVPAIRRCCGRSDPCGIPRRRGRFGPGRTICYPRRRGCACSGPTGPGGRRSSSRNRLYPGSCVCRGGCRVGSSRRVFVIFCPCRLFCNGRSHGRGDRSRTRASAGIVRRPDGHSSRPARPRRCRRVRRIGRRGSVRRPGRISRAKEGAFS